jgi:hypothetical protein
LLDLKPHVLYFKVEGGLFGFEFERAFLGTLHVHRV